MERIRLAIFASIPLPVKHWVGGDRRGRSKVDEERLGHPGKEAERIVAREEKEGDG